MPLYKGNLANLNPYSLDQLMSVIEDRDLSCSCWARPEATLVRIWPLHCSLGNQNTITCKLELHAIQLKGRCASLHAKGPQGSGMQG